MTTNRNVLVVCATAIVIALIAGAVILSTGGRTITTNFMTLSGLVLVQVVLALINLARTEKVSEHVDQVANQVNGRFTAQQEITRKALEVIPPVEAAKITNALNPPPDGLSGVESTTAGQPPSGQDGQRDQQR